MNTVRLGLAVILVASGALILLLVSAPDRANEPDRVNEKIHRFSVGNIPMALALTEAIEIVPLKDPKIGIRLDFRPGWRQPQQIEITIGDAACPPNTCTKSARMRNGAELEYRTELHSGGSGGAEADLTGVLRSKRFSLNIHCLKQDELESDPAWCLWHLWRLQFD